MAILPQLSVLIITIPQNYHVLFTPLPLTLDSRFLTSKDQVAFVYVSQGLCTEIGTPRVYIKKVWEKKSELELHKSQTDLFEYLLILSKRFVSGNSRSSGMFRHVPT